MNPDRDALLRVVLDDGPFPSTVVSAWPPELREDYLQLLALDLEAMGYDEFRRLRRALGEAYLLSLGRPIAANAVLLEAWNALTGGEPPPHLPVFLHHDLSD
jgi:hypothetical protein